MATTVPDPDQVRAYGAFPLGRFQRAGASGAQISAAQSWWTNTSTTTTQQVQHGLLVEQISDAEVLTLAQGSWPVASITTKLHVANQAHN